MAVVFVTIPAAIAIQSANDPPIEDVEYTTGKSNLVGEPSDMSGYTFLDQDKADYFINTSFEKTVEMITNNESGIVYIGFQECEWCQRAVPVLAEMASETKSIVYYLNVDNEDITGNTYKQFKALFKNELSEDSDGERVLMTPLVLAIKDGKVVDSHTSLVKGFEIKSETDNLNKDQFNELLTIYKVMQKKVY